MAWRQRGVTVPVEGEGIALEGVWLPGENRTGVIAPAHPELSGSLDNPVASELAYAFTKAGFASLLFNWRGVGASEGQVTGDPAAAEADFRAALEHLLDRIDARRGRLRKQARSQLARIDFEAIGPALRETLDIPEQYEILLVLALGKPAETVVLEDVGADGSIKYYRDDQDVHHVPKRTLDELIVREFGG